MDRLPELQTAMRAIDGVASASVRWPDPAGPATLHVTLNAAADGEGVAAAVLEAMERVAGVTAAALDITPVHTGRVTAPTTAPHRPDDRTSASVGTRPAPEQAARPDPAGGDEPDGDPTDLRHTRPVFTGLLVERSDLHVTVTVTLDHGGEGHSAIATGLATRRSTPRVAASAALLALTPILPAGLRLQLEWLEVVESISPDRPDIIHAAVTCLTAEGEETRVGTAMVRSDLDEAAVRATLDAVNRRLELLVARAG